ncbi:hypothetical protein [Aurantiacibacter odishensis]|uniref:hypothetical protein n=1 Tax=Aurantiacibacter odishensis TaxID=1155476 RepID=UPI000E75F96B|nr:hypothetical protein [Aurantiacibacter odishensis]
MADLEHQLQQDRALRNAAKRLVKADFGFVKGDMAQKGLGGRIAGRAKDGAADIAESTADYASEHRLQVGTGIAVAVAAFAGWIFRDRLADAVYNLFHEKGLMEQAADKAEQLAEDARSLFD